MKFFDSPEDALAVSLIISSFPESKVFCCSSHLKKAFLLLAFAVDSDKELTRNLLDSLLSENIEFISVQALNEPSSAVH